MNRFAKVITTILAGAVVATPVLAQERQRVSAECREEIIELCASDGTRDRAKIRSCVRKNVSKLSESCAAEIRARMEGRQKSRGDRSKGSENSEG